ncbi:unnamed protein product [Polarella glacialis]|uniref:Pentatricopeptide repeat-containing protein, chloroplastic n=1 Tax=Polarella glacialis TaxID=89957 RepID=A0A813FYY2_POLGL|nr:unnamed protein product [Polarella glacialis]
MQWEYALDLLRAMRRLGLQLTLMACTSAVTSLSCISWQRALAVFHEIPRPNTVAYNAALSAAERGSQWEQAMALLQDLLFLKMKQPAGTESLRRLGPDQISFSAAISACGAASRWQQSIALLRSLPMHGLKADVVAYNAAISAAALSESEEAFLAFDLAWELFLEVTAASLEPSMVTFNSAINAAEKARRWAEALMLLELARIDSEKLDGISFNSAISACEKCSEWRPALSLLAAMGARGLACEAAACGPLLRSLEQQGLVSAEEELLQVLVSPAG